jgi:hypothetical protein
VETVEKLRLSEVRAGQWCLPDLHRALLRRALPDETITIAEGSAWLSARPRGPRDYYVDIFLALTGEVVLFESFETDKEEEKFFASVVRPALLEAMRILGREPAITPLCKGRHRASRLWYAYPDSYREHFEALGVQL